MRRFSSTASRGDGTGRRPKRRVLAGVLTLVLAGAALVAGAPVADAAATQHRPTVRVRYVALGDSYSSGEGTFVYRSGTDTASDRCHRSDLGYAALLSDVRPRLRRLTFAACSGAITRDLYAPNHEYPSEPAQLSALTPRTRTVTATIGGNDLGFASVVGACITGARTTPCSTNPALVGLVNLRLAALATGSAVTGAAYPIVPIHTVLADIAARAPKATMYLAGYPQLFGTSAAGYAPDPTVPSGRSCTVNAAVGAVVGYADAQWIDRTTAQLNGVLQTAVRQARAAGVRAVFVPAGTFAGHGLCDTGSAWINPLVIGADGGVRSESLHPNVRGQVAYALAFLRAGV